MQFIGLPTNLSQQIPSLGTNLSQQVPSLKTFSIDN